MHKHSAIAGRTRARVAKFNKALALPAIYGLVAFTRASFAAPLIVSHVPYRSEDIATFDFASAQLTAAFTSDGSATDANGLGVEVVGNNVYYTGIQLSGGIHVAPYNNGLGGADTAVLPNPRPGGFGYGIQDLDYHKGVLYALTGFPLGLPIVYGLNPATGDVISSVEIHDHAWNNADGFTVLPNGNFLINDTDESPTYRAYNPTTGNPTGLVFTLPAGMYTTGVDYNANDNRLYYNGVVPDGFFLARTKLNGTFLDLVHVPVDVPEVAEDISVIATPRTFWGDLSGNWSDLPMWTGDVPNVVASEANFDDSNTDERNVLVDLPVVIGTLNLDSPVSYTIAGANNLTFDVVSGVAAINVTQGSHTISAPIVQNDDLAVGVALPASVLTLSGSLTATGKTIAKSGAGTLLVKNVRATGLIISSGTVGVLADGTAAGTSNVDTLSIAPGARLNLTNNKLITNNAAGTQTAGVYNGVQGLVQSGYGSGIFDGTTGIITTETDATNSSGLTAIGVSTGALARSLGPTDTDLWAGQTINGNSTLVMYTYAGDANLDGFIDGTDYFYIDSNVGTSADGYGNGDFNYDGAIDGTDYFFIDSNITSQGAPFFASGGTGELLTGVAAVPEPGSIALLSLAAASIFRRQRR